MSGLLIRINRVPVLLRPACGSGAASPPTAGSRSPSPRPCACARRPDVGLLLLIFGVMCGGFAILAWIADHRMTDEQVDAWLRNHRTLPW
jgi:hypothetical protein